MAGLRRRGEIDFGKAIDVARAARRGAGSLLYIVVVLVAVAVITVLSMNVRERWDLSVLKANSLSPQSREVARALEEDVNVYALFTTRERRREHYRELLRLYEEESPHIRVEMIDPVARPGVVREIGLNPEDENTRRDGISVVTRGDRKLVFFGIEEEDVTNAILEVGATRKRVVGFLRGYGEREILSDLDSGMDQAVASLRAEYYDVVDVSLAEPIPAEVMVLVAAGPTRPIPQDHLDRLARWLDEGGRLLAMLDPESESGLGAVLRGWGLGTTGLQVLEPQQNNLYGRAEFLRIVDFSQHPVSRGFSRNLPVTMPVAEAVEHFEPGDPLVFHEELCRTSGSAIGLRPDGTREQGPFHVAAASWKTLDGEGSRGRETRVILVGDSDFVSNEYVLQFSNQNFFLNCVGWLSRVEELVSVRRPPLAGQVVHIASDEWWIVWTLSFAPILAVIFVGVAVGIRRRKL